MHTHNHAYTYNTVTPVSFTHIHTISGARGLQQMLHAEETAAGGVPVNPPPQQPHTHVVQLSLPELDAQLAELLLRKAAAVEKRDGTAAVSFTHPTLPTNTET